MATEKVVTKVKYRLKNGTSTTLPLGTTSDYIQMDDGDQENLTQRLETLEEKTDTVIRPKKLDILKVQSYLDAGTIEQYCKIGDYVELNPDGKGTTKFYVIGINGHNGQSLDSIYKDHIDFYGGAVADFGSVLPTNNYTIGDATPSAAWQTTTFFKNYIDSPSYSLSENIRKDFFGLNESYSSLNFAKKIVSYDTRHASKQLTSTLLGYFGFTYTDELWEKFQELTQYDVKTDSTTNDDGTLSLTENFKNAILAIKVDTEISLRLLRASVKLEPNLDTFPVDASDSLVITRRSVNLVTTTGELVQLYNLYMRIYEWVSTNGATALKSSTGWSRNSWFLWMLTEEEIDNNNIFGTPIYTARTGYSYPFFQNKQLFRLLFPSSISGSVLNSITPKEGSFNDYVGWVFRSSIGPYKEASFPSQNTSVEGFGFRLESKSNLISYPS